MNLRNMRQYGPRDCVDAVVIGTGAGGAPLIAKLARAGLKVVALESGPVFNPVEYAADELAAAKLYWTGERLSAGGTSQAFGGNNSGTGVGGSTLHWGAFIPRADPDDLCLKTKHGNGVDWPLTYGDLKPYYETVEADIGASGPSPYPWDADRIFPLPPIALNAPARAMQAGCNRLGIKTAPAPVAAVSRDAREPDGRVRQACANCGHCHQGCRNGAKASMDVTYLPDSVGAGAEIRPGCFVNGFELGRGGAVTGVTYLHNGREHMQACRAVFLCAGAVESPRLLLHAGLANASGQVGRNYMAHVATQVWGTFLQQMRCYKGYPSSLISEDMIRPPAADFAGGYIMQSLGVLPVTWANQVARSRGLWGQSLTDYIARYNRVAGIGINGECLPYDHNFLELSSEKDATDVPKPRIHFTYGHNETRLSDHAAGLMSAIWKEAGADDIWVCQRAAHTIGTCRMGTDPGTSVVNPFGRTHDVPNLWICDNSVFPSALEILT